RGRRCAAGGDEREGHQRNEELAHRQDSIIRAMRRQLAALLLVCFAVPVLAASPAPAVGARGMVVAPEREAAEIGVSVLKSGGNAIDAAVAMAIALAVTYPRAGNLAGGGFLLYRSPDGAYHALDFREPAPAALTVKIILGPAGNQT